MQGVLARGTPRAISRLAPYVAGKTEPRTRKTTPGSWASLMTSPLRLAGLRQRQRQVPRLGATGGGVAVPIFESIIQAVRANAAPKTALALPSP
jgi:penicillin-binding protein 1A